MRYFLLLNIITTLLLAQNFSARYDVDVKLFGKVGYADITLKEDKNSYEIQLVANTIGAVATLLGNRVETFISRGKIVGGGYVPDVFIKIKETTKKTRHQTYYFDYQKKEINEVEEKTKLVSRLKFDSRSFKVISKEIKKSEKKETILDEFKSSDILTTYLNRAITCNEGQKDFKISAVGSHDDKNDISLHYLEGKEKLDIATNFSHDIKDIYKLHVNPHDKSDSIVDVFIGFDEKGFLKEALLGEIFWVGKITAKRVYLK